MTKEEQQAQAEATYLRLRREQREAWNHVNPRTMANRKRTAYIHADRIVVRPYDPQPDAASRWLKQEMAKLNAELVEYDLLTWRKFCAAILAGRYDFAIKRGEPAGSCSNPSIQAMCLDASRERAAFIGAPCDY